MPSNALFREGGRLDSDLILDSASDAQQGPVISTDYTYPSADPDSQLGGTTRRPQLPLSPSIRGRSAHRAIW